MAHKTILLKGDPLQKERKAAGAITPGHLIELDTSGELIVHATDGAIAANMFALENSLMGSEIGTAYADDDRVQYIVGRAGDEVYAWLADGENVSIGDFLVSKGDGTLRKMSGDSATEEAVVAQALEALNLAASANTADGRLEVEIM